MVKIYTTSLFGQYNKRYFEHGFAQKYKFMTFVQDPFAQKTLAHYRNDKKSRFALTSEYVKCECQQNCLPHGNE